MSEECEHGRAVWTCLQCADNHRPMALWSVVEEARKERDAAIERAENAESTIKETNGQLNRYGEALRALWALLPKELIVQGASVVDQTRKHISELTERAEKAEAALNELRESYLMESISVDLGARAQFERETAARLLAAEYGAPDDEISFENAIEVESYWQRRAMWAKRTASVLADACFGAKEAKG